VETAECWALALDRRDGPSLLALSRQNLPQLRTERTANLSARGAYRLRSAIAPRRVVLLATGSEVVLALEAAEEIDEGGLGTYVVLLPSRSLFFAPIQPYCDGLLPSQFLLLPIEAGSTLGWERYTGHGSLRIVLVFFGASATAE